MGYGFGDMEREHEEKMDSLVKAYDQAEIDYRGEMDGHLEKAQNHLKELFRISEESGLPFHINGEQEPWYYLFDMERWRTVSIPKSYKQKFAGLCWDGTNPDKSFGLTSHGQEFQYWIPSSEC